MPVVLRLRSLVRPLRRPPGSALVGLAFLLLAVPASVRADEDARAAAEAARATFAERVGTWVADNAAYRSDGEPFEAYLLEWSWGLGEWSLNGRLYGLRDDERVGPFWEFRQFWHPGEERVVVQQFDASGTFGSGALERFAGGDTRLDQVFHAADGGTWETRHVSTLVDGVDRSRTFRRDETGAWVEGRTYEWRRRP